MAHHRRIPARITALISTAAALTLAAGAGQASASVPGLQHVSKSSQSPMMYSKSVTVPCPPGKRVLGVGGQINGGQFNGKPGPIAIRELTPSADLTSATASAVEYAGGTPSAWDVEVFAVCADPLPGLTMKPGTSLTNSLPAKTATANCPNGTQLLGTGAKTSVSALQSGPLPGDVSIEKITPNGLTGVEVRAYETENELAASWTLSAYAICASPLPGLEVMSSVPTYSVGPKTATATCSAGKSVLGTGAAIAHATSDVLSEFGEVVFNGIVPASDSVLSSAIPDSNGTFDSWSVRSYAICATP